MKKVLKLARSCLRAAGFAFRCVLFLLVLGLLYMVLQLTFAVLYHGKSLARFRLQCLQWRAID